VNDVIVSVVGDIGNDSCEMIKMIELAFVYQTITTETPNACLCGR